MFFVSFRRSLYRAGDRAAGVVDAATVTRSGVQNAASIAGLFLTTEAIVADKPEDEDDQHGHDH